MYLANERLPHLLPPSAYWSEDQYARESVTIFSPAWHFVAVMADLSRPGDFVTTEVCGRPIQIRNIDGQIHAVSNICAHRHCLLTSLRKGSSPKLHCQYHGWEYDASGQTRRIPSAGNFAPFERDAARLDVYRIATAGELVFVNFDSDSPDLQTSLGDSWQKICQAFGYGHLLTLRQETDLPVNWKVPIENSLEAYHVPSIHSNTLRNDPGETRSEHRLEQCGSSFHTKLPFAPHSKMDARFQKTEGMILKTLTGLTPTAIYEQHHLFPNILCSFTDMISLIHVVRPTGPETCTSIVYQFGRVGTSLPSRIVCRWWGRMAAGITQSILEEDFELFPDIQHGLKRSSHTGMLGRCEERIHHFQAWLEKQTAGSRSTTNSPANQITSLALFQCNGCGTHSTARTLDDGEL